MKPLKTVKTTIVASAGALTLMATRVLAETTDQTAQKAVDNIGGTNNTTDLNAFVTNIINILIGVVGVAAVIMLIVGGLRYVFSGGDEKSTKAAKDTILYAIIGIVVALLAFAIVNFVLTGITGG